MKRIQLTETDLTRLIHRVIKEQTNPDMPVPPVNDDKISPSMTSDEFLTEIDKMCFDISKSREKFLGNRSCSRCHTDVMNLLKSYCVSREK